MARPPRRGEDLSTRAFRALLALYPAAFRDEYRREMTLVFVDRYRGATSRWDRATLWFDAIHGIAAEAPKEHLHMILHDLRYALRVLRQHKLVTATIVITLGLGIGVNTAIFSLLNAVLLRTLPVADPGQLFAVRASSPLASGDRFSGPMFDRLREGAPEGVGVAAMSRVARVHTRVEGALETEPAALQLVSTDYFRVLGVSPARGRPWLGDGGELAAPPVVVVSHAYWQRRFHGSPDVVGQPLTINGTSFSVVGVGPRGFTGVWLESPVDLWVPLSMQRDVKYSQNYSADGADFTRGWLSQERIWWLNVIARSRLENAAATATALDGSVRPFAKNDARIALEPFAQGFSGLRQRFETPLYALTAMAALVLFIACANVANLLLARAAGRQPEIALRMSLGARRARVLQQLVTESALLVVMAGAAALLFARWAGDVLVRTATASVNGPLPFVADLDMRVLGFTAAVALVSVLLFGLMPAWRATRLDLATAIKIGPRGCSAGTATRPARVLVVLQVALSLVLLMGTGLVVRSFRNILDINVGFDREHLLSVTIDPRLSGTPPEQLPELHRRLLDATLAVPGVSSASLAMCGLQSSCRAREDGIDIEGYQARPDEQVVFTVNAVTPGYFSNVGMRLIAGRAFTDRDLENTPKVAVVNRTLARKYFVDGQAIGRHFGEGTRDVEIVGIVDDARILSVKEPPVPSAFFSLVQRPVMARYLEIRTIGDPRHTAAAVRRAIAEAAPALPIEAIMTVEERLRVSLNQERLMVFLTSGFGALALGLAGFGLFGLLSYAVARRTSEFGIRMALGASRAHVLTSVVVEALRLVLYGFLLGIPIVLLSGGLVSSLFFGVEPNDWATLVGATLILVCVGAICSVLPAMRASRVDLVVALRAE